MCKQKASCSKRVCILCFLLMLVSASTYAVEFSADMVHTMDGKTTVSKVYVTSKKMRVETDQGGGVEGNGVGLE